jgi:hypothetical protein
MKTSITEIPDNAFRPLSGIQYNLTTVHIENHKLTKIGNNAFQYWPSLEELALFNYSLNYISEKTFNFEKLSWIPTSPRLFLKFFNNNLNGSSFQIGSFNGFIKPTQLHFEAGPNDKSNITYLDQKSLSPSLMIIAMNWEIVYKC